MTQRRIDFGPIEVTYDDEVLVPRPWTLEQSRWAVELLTDLPEGPVLEVCAGAGHIGQVVALETGRALVQVDLDDRACTYARANAARAGVASDVRCGDLEQALAPEERFPFVLADPPYIPTDEIGRHAEDPVVAIDGGPDGLDIARTCIRVAADHLHERGLVLLQLGSGEQAETLRPEAAGHGLEILEVRRIVETGTLVLLRRTRRSDPTEGCSAYLTADGRTARLRSGTDRTGAATP